MQRLGCSGRERAKVMLPLLFVASAAGSSAGPGTFVGDVNGDGLLNESDITAIESLLNAKGAKPENYPFTADVNQDRRLDAADLELLEELLRGEPTVVIAPVVIEGDPTVPGSEWKVELRVVSNTTGKIPCVIGLHIYQDEPGAGIKHYDPAQNASGDWGLFDGGTIYTNTTAPELPGRYWRPEARGRFISNESTPLFCAVTFTTDQPVPSGSRVVFTLVPDVEASVLSTPGLEPLPAVVVGGTITLAP